MKRYYPGTNNKVTNKECRCPEHKTLYEETRGPVLYRERECTTCGWIHQEYLSRTPSIDPATFAAHVLNFRPTSRSTD